MICKKMETLKKSFIEKFIERFGREAWFKYVPIEEIVDAMVDGIDIEKLMEVIERAEQRLVDHIKGYFEKPHDEKNGK